MRRRRHPPTSLTIGEEREWSGDFRWDHMKSPHSAPPREGSPDIERTPLTKIYIGTKLGLKMSNHQKCAHRLPGGGEKNGEWNNGKMKNIFNFIFH